MTNSVSVNSPRKNKKQLPAPVRAGVSNPFSRRNFLKGALQAAVGSFLMTRPGQGHAKAVEPEKRRRQPLATLIDIRRCVGCEACVEACRKVNGPDFPRPEKPFPRMFPDRVPVEDWSDRQSVSDRLTPYNWLYIQKTTIDIDGAPVELNIPRRCMHCDNPPCVKLCPWGAARQEPSGLSWINADICLGGSKCNKVCPWDIPQRQTGVGLYLDLLPAFAGNGVMYKCHRCHTRIEKGKVPACIEACPANVQIIGPKKQIIQKARALARQQKGYIYGAAENGGTGTIYVSPVPFDVLHQATASGKGRPGFQSVKNYMADTAMAARSLLIAPVAGMAAALGRVYLSGRASAGDE